MENNIAVEADDHVIDARLTIDAPLITCYFY